MRKIISSKEKEEQDKKKQRIFAIIIGVVMALSTAGFAINFATTQQKVKYNGLTFTQSEKGWVPKGYSLVTTYLPGEVENISLSGIIDPEDFNSKVYLIELPYVRAGVVEFVQNVPIQSYQQACLAKYENESFCADVPTKSCEDANSGNVMLILDEDNETSVTYTKYCLTIKGSQEDITKGVDKAIFSAYGIIK